MMGMMQPLTATVANTRCVLSNSRGCLQSTRRLLQADKIPSDSLPEIAEKGAKQVQEIKDGAVEKVESAVAKVAPRVGCVWHPPMPPLLAEVAYNPSPWSAHACAARVLHGSYHALAVQNMAAAHPPRPPGCDRVLACSDWCACDVCPSFSMLVAIVCMLIGLPASGRGGTLVTVS
jgi:hypothetical protein